MVAPLLLALCGGGGGGGGGFCYLHWWAFPSPNTTFTLLPHVVAPLLLALCGSGGGSDHNVVVHDGWMQWCGCTEVIVIICMCMVGVV